MGNKQSNKKINIMIVGLDNSGKTTLIHQMKYKYNLEMHIGIGPTVGYNVEQFKNKNINYTVFDMSGQYSYRELWTTYSQQSHGIIFVIDATDQMRLQVAKNELFEVLKIRSNQETQGPILIFSNKMDLPDAVNVNTISEQLDLISIYDRSWTIIPSIAITGSGVNEGLEWLNKQFNNK